MKRDRLKGLIGLSILIILFSVTTSCNRSQADGDVSQTNNNRAKLTRWVNPFIGTGGHGHTFPGASMPNGMVQLSPDTRLEGWDACSGYHSSDEMILGFSHTHLSGTGIGDYGDILFMPVVNFPVLEKNAKNNYSHSYASKKKADSELARPGYYRVILEEDNIGVELTTTKRSGFHRYTFNSNPAKIIVDLNHTLQSHHQVDNIFEIVGPNEIRGVKKTRGWAREHEVYFHAVFSMPFNAKFAADSSIALLNFGERAHELLVKVGISHVDVEGAKKNLDSEILDWSFDRVMKAGEETWNEYLSTVEVEGGTIDQKTVFYTALYHAALAPNIFSDVDGRYMGMDRQIHHSDRSIYTVFSLWDTFRALHPLNTILRPRVNQDMIHSLLTKYQEGGVLPKWELAGNYTGTMSGYHAVPVIVDSFMKGQRDFDINTAYEAVVHASTYDTTNVRFFDEEIKNHLMPKAKYYNNTLGFIPADMENESVSKALEYAYNDWCIAQMAKEMNREKDYKHFLERSKRYNQYFDRETGFMRGKLASGEWREPFDPKYSRHRKDDYVEGNAWQWSWFVPHDIDGLVALHGNEENFVRKLDQLFNESSEITGEQSSADISGLIGQYAHGNEPSHHIAYMYNYVNQPYKTQEIVREILDTQYRNDHDGLSGNEDCGQMSAWYVMSAMGLYQVAPGDPTYTLGSPIFDQVTIHLDNGEDFVIKAEDNSPEKIYSNSYRLNGEYLKLPFISHEEIESGGELTIDKTNI